MEKLQKFIKAIQSFAKWGAVVGAFFEAIKVFAEKLKEIKFEEKKDEKF